MKVAGRFRWKEYLENNQDLLLEDLGQIWHIQGDIHCHVGHKDFHLPVFGDWSTHHPLPWCKKVPPPQKNKALLTMGFP